MSALIELLGIDRTKAEHAISNFHIDRNSDRNPADCARDIARSIVEDVVSSLPRHRASTNYAAYRSNTTTAFTEFAAQYARTIVSAMQVLGENLNTTAIRDHLKNPSLSQFPSFSTFLLTRPITSPQIRMQCVVRAVC